MGVSIRKTVVTAIAALGLAAAVATVSTPAEAQWHGGGGFHGGGWRRRLGRGLAWRRLGRRRLARRLGRPPGLGRWLGLASRRMGPRLGRRLGRRLLELRLGLGLGWDPGWGIAAATVPIGIAIAANGAPGYGDNRCWVRRRVWDERGRYMGRLLVNVCM